MAWLHEPLDVVTASSIFFTTLLAASFVLHSRFQKHLLPASIVVDTLNVAQHAYLARSCLAAFVVRWNGE